MHQSHRWNEEALKRQRCILSRLIGGRLSDIGRGTNRFDDSPVRLRYLSQTQRSKVPTSIATRTRDREIVAFEMRSTCVIGRCRCGSRWNGWAGFPWTTHAQVRGDMAKLVVNHADHACVLLIPYIALGGAPGAMGSRNRSAVAGVAAGEWDELIAMVACLSISPREVTTGLSPLSCLNPKRSGFRRVQLITTALPKNETGTLFSAWREMRPSGVSL